MSTLPTALKIAYDLVSKAETQIMHAYDVEFPNDVTLCAVNIHFDEEYTTDGDDRPVTAVFDFNDASDPPSPEDLNEKLGPLFKSLGVEQIHIKRMHYEDSLSID